MCINGRDTTVLQVSKSKAILAYRHWGISYEYIDGDWRYVLCPSFTTSYWSGNKQIRIENPWGKLVAVSNRKPPASYASDFGLHASAEPVEPGCVAAGTVRLWGRVVVHRYERTGAIAGYRAQYARVTSISRSLSNQDRIHDLEGIAKRLGARMVK